MIATLIARLVALGCPPGLAKPLLGIVAALVILGALWGGKCAYDRSVIDKHDAKVEAKTAKADRKADSHAAEQRRADDTRLTNETEELKRSTDHAQTNHERSLARARCIRLQQSARAAGRQSPSCAGLNVPR
jgi:flagellar biosynthesis component FlhA